MHIARRPELTRSCEEHFVNSMRNIKIRSLQPNVAPASVRRRQEGNPRSKSTSGPAARRRRDSPVGVARLALPGDCAKRQRPSDRDLLLGLSNVRFFGCLLETDLMGAHEIEALTQASMRLLDRTEGLNHRSMVKSLGIVCPPWRANRRSSTIPQRRWRAAS
jgi:hypothetical protein